MGVQVPPPAFSQAHFDPLILILRSLASLCAFIAGVAPWLCCEAAPPDLRKMHLEPWLAFQASRYEEFQVSNRHQIRSFLNESLIADPGSESSADITLRATAGKRLPVLEIGSTTIALDEVVPAPFGPNLLRVSSDRRHLALSIETPNAPTLCVVPLHEPARHVCSPIPGLYDVAWLGNSALLASKFCPPSRWQVEERSLLLEPIRNYSSVDIPHGYLLMKSDGTSALIEHRTTSNRRFWQLRAGDSTLLALPKGTAFAATGPHTTVYLKKSMKGWSLGELNSNAARSLPTSFAPSALFVKGASVHIEGFEHCLPREVICTTNRCEMRDIPDAGYQVVRAADGLAISVRVNESAVHKPLGMIVRFYGAYEQRIPALPQKIMNALEERHVAVAEIGVRGGGECGLRDIKDRSRTAALGDLMAGLHALQKQYPGVPLILWTRSAGALLGAAIMSKSPDLVKGALFEAPFVSPREWASSVHAQREALYFGTIGFANLLGTTTGPIHLWLGGADQEVPLSWTRAWIDAHAPQALVRVDTDAGHAGPSTTADQDALWAEQIAFVESLL